MNTGPIMKLDRYEVKEEIASGGMAAVFKGFQTGPGGFKSEVALKVMHSHLAKDPRNRRLFLREARMAAKLRHRNILSVLDFGEKEGIAFMVTEYFPSMNLEHLVKKAGKIPLEHALFILSEIAEALDFAHKAKDEKGRHLCIVHRDVSPQNILIGEDGRVKLIDFGIAKGDSDTDKTRSGVIKGKFRYMAPEQAAGQKIDRRADIYALGVVFIRMISGKRPFGHGDTAQLLARAKAGVEKEVRKAKIPENVKTFLRKVTDVDPKCRYQSAGTVARQARKLLGTIAPSYGSHTLSDWIRSLDKSSIQTNHSKCAGTIVDRTGTAKLSKNDYEDVFHRRAQKERRIEKHTVNLAHGYNLDNALHPAWVFGTLLFLLLVAVGMYLLS